MESFLAVNYSDPFYFGLLSSILFTVIFLRYLLVSGVYHYLFFKVFRRRVDHRIISTQAVSRRQLWQEVGRSALTSLIFALSGTGMVIAWQRGYTRLYTDWSDYPVWYVPLSILIAFFLHETYYYWIHRWMHRPGVYRLVHKWHHDSIHTTSLTSFSFHPLESILQAIVIPVLVFFLPLHLYALFFLLIVMTISGTVNHAGVEIYPHRFERHWLGRWLIGATHHDMHHKNFRCNYGLYFTFWDKWMHTESPEYERRFREQTGGPEPDNKLGPGQKRTRTVP